MDATISEPQGTRGLLTWLKPVHLLVAAALGFCVADAAMALDLVGARRTESRLAADLAVASRVANAVPQPSLAHLQAASLAAEGRQQVAAAAIPTQLKPTLLLENLFQLAGQSSVQVLNAQMRKPTKRTVGTNSYLVQPVMLEVEGKAAAFVQYLRSVETLAGQTLVVVGTQVVKTAEGDSLSIELEVYQRTPQSSPVVGAPKR